MNSENKLFLRQASGLRRSASALDVFIFNTGLISVGLAIAFNAYYLPAFYPAARVDVTSAIATGLMLLAGVGFYLWAVLLPRSGGNYVFISRAFHPSIGFLVSWIEVLVLLFYTAVAAALIVRIGASSFLGGLGVTLRIPALSQLGETIAGPFPTFFLGALVICLSTLLLGSGMRLFFVVQKIMFALAILGTIAILIGILNIEPGNVAVRLAGLFPGYSVDSAVAAAADKGWSIAEPSFDGSFSAIGWPLLPLAGGILSIGIGAEIQRARRSQLIGILGSIAFCGLLFVVIGSLVEHAIGRQLLGAIAYNASQNNSAEVPGGIPWVHFLVAVLADSFLISLFAGLGIVAWIYLWIPGMLAYCNRSFLAWSLDRVAPAWLGEVSPLRQTPINSSILGGGVAVIFLAAYMWLPGLQDLIVFQMLIFAWAISLLAGALFPYLRQRLYQTATAGGAVIRSKALFSSLMAVGAVALSVSGVVLWNDPVAAGHSPMAIATIVGVGLSGAILYALAVIVRSRQGVDISRSFREIPVE